jgi:hypothetical protein
VAILYLLVPLVVLTLFVGYMERRRDDFLKYDDEVTEDMISEAFERGDDQ